MPTLTTDRLRLYPISDDAMRALQQAEPDPEMQQAYGEMLAGAVAHPAQRIWYAVWVMESLQSPGTILGDLCFKGLSPDGMVELGYGIHPAYEGQGLTTEAVIALTAWAAAQPGVTRVEAETDPGNAASQRILQKAGYRPTGTLGAEGPRFVHV